MQRMPPLLLGAMDVLPPRSEPLALLAVPRTCLCNEALMIDLWRRARGDASRVAMGLRIASLTNGLLMVHTETETEIRHLARRVGLKDSCVRGRLETLCPQSRAARS